MVEEQTLKSLC